VYFEYDAEIWREVPALYAMPIAACDAGKIAGYLR
jgi:hypothetical protein